MLARSIIHRTPILLAAALLAAALVACADTAGPQHATPDRLDVAFSVEPETVQRYWPFEAILTIRNTSAETVEVRSACASLASLHIFRSGEPVALSGSQVGCYPVLTTHELAPGEAIEQRWELEAEDGGEAPIAPGTYTARVEFHVYDLPDLERTFQVE